MITAQQLGFRVGKAQLLRDITLEFEPGKFWSILGPNGAGKSTLLRLIGGVLTPTAGTVAIAGQSLKRWNPNALARKRSFLTQEHQVSQPLLAQEVILMGRYPHFRSSPARKDLQAIEKAIEMTGINMFRERRMDQLSGGERKRVHLARVLAQIMQEDGRFKDQILLLDEPLNNLDINFQFQTLQIARRVTQEGGTVVMVLHDLVLIPEFATHAALLKDTRLTRFGPASDVLTPEHVRETFGVPFLQFQHDDRIIAALDIRNTPDPTNTRTPQQ